LLFLVKSILVLPFWYRLTQVTPEGHKTDVCVCVYVFVCVFKVNSNALGICLKLEQLVLQLIWLDAVPDASQRNCSIPGLHPFFIASFTTAVFIYPLTPFLIINHPLSASSIFYGP